MLDFTRRTAALLLLVLLCLPQAGCWEEGTLGSGEQAGSSERKSPNGQDDWFDYDLDKNGLKVSVPRSASLMSLHKGGVFISIHKLEKPCFFCDDIFAVTLSIEPYTIEEFGRIQTDIASSTRYKKADESGKEFLSWMYSYRPATEMRRYGSYIYYRRDYKRSDGVTFRARAEIIPVKEIVEYNDEAVVQKIMDSIGEKN